MLHKNLTVMVFIMIIHSYMILGCNQSFEEPAKKPSNNKDNISIIPKTNDKSGISFEKYRAIPYKEAADNSKNIEKENVATGSSQQTASVQKVCVSDTGKYYHRKPCRKLERPYTRIPIEKAKSKYSPCPMCYPSQ